MKNAMKLLDAIGQIQDAYILDAHSEYRKPRHYLVAAVIAAVLLLLSGCAVLAWRWYAVYFAEKQQQPLSEGQIAYIADNTREYRDSQTYDGYTLTLKSVITEQYTAYLTFSLTAPEDVDLSTALDLRTEERLSFHGLRAMQADGGLPANLNYSIHDDGDGKKNTLNVVLQLDPVYLSAEGRPAGDVFQITLEEIIHWGYDWDYARQLEEGKYTGQKDYLLTSEESSRLHPQTVLASGKWKFEFRWPAGETSAIELLTAPISVKAFVSREGDTESDWMDTVEPVMLTSVQIDPLGITITFVPPEPVEKLIGVELNDGSFDPSGSLGELFLMMRDGTRITFFQYEGAKENARLTADSPVIPKEADYLQLADGTKLAVPVE